MLWPEWSFIMACHDSISFYLDGSYIAGFSNDFNPVTDGYGSFNGNMLTITVGFHCP